MRLAGSGGKRRKARRKRKGLLVRDGTMIDWHKEGAKKDIFHLLLVGWCYGKMDQYFVWCGCVILLISALIRLIFFFLVFVMDLALINFCFV